MSTVIKWVFYFVIWGILYAIGSSILEAMLFKYFSLPSELTQETQYKSIWWIGWWHSSLASLVIVICDSIFEKDKEK